MKFGKYLKRKLDNFCNSFILSLTKSCFTKNFILKSKKLDKTLNAWCEINLLESNEDF